MKASRDERIRLADSVMKAGVPVFCADADGRLTLVNKAFEELTGHTRDEILGRPLPVDDRKGATEWIKAAKDGVSSSCEIRLTRKDGAPAPALLSLSVIEGNGRSPRRLLGILIDPLAAGSTHRRAIQAEKMAAVSTLARGIAHGFNNLNGVVKGLLDINLRNSQLPPELRKDLETMHRTICRAIQITEDLSTFARKKPSAQAPADINRIVLDVLKIVQDGMESEGIHVAVGLSGDELELLVDEALISHVILELITNARRAMLESETKELGISTGVSGGRAFVRVSDTGRGMSDGDIAQIFDPFFTGGEAAQSAGGPRKRLPSGLGLSICHTVVEEHRGEIEVQSKPGQGATFTVWLPLPEGRRTPPT